MPFTIEWQAVKRLQHVAVDVLICALAFEFAYLLRFDFNVPVHERPMAIAQLPLAVAVQMAALLGVGVYRFIWRYIGLRELKTFLSAAALSAFPLLVLRATLSDAHAVWRVPVSVTFISTIIAFSGAVAVRVLRRVVYEQYQRPHGATSDDARPKPVLLIGAGRAGKITADEISRVRRRDLDVKGFVDDNPAKKAAIIHGVKVLGTTDDLPRLVKEFEIDHVVITMARASRQDIRRIVEICERIPVKTRIIPSLQEILSGTVTVSRIRDVQIDDLLGRAPVDLSQENAGVFIHGRTVLVTGAGGSIGSELARQVARHRPGRLLLVERAEWALFNIDLELRRTHPSLHAVPIVADVANRARMAQVFAEHSPQLVIHAAAHKHVPLMESQPSEAAANNVLATRDLGELAGRSGVEAFVLVSTDKAVRPTSVMGATKRLAELTIQRLNAEYATRFVAVRFGNVIGSSGSVIPIFRAQIEKGGPVTVTHPEMTRYFMTIPEAAQLVLEAATLGDGGEIFVLDMGEPVRILDLARDLIRLSGLRPFEDVEIVFSGMRPGEKLFEELEMSEEALSKTRHPKVFIGQISGLPPEAVDVALSRLERAVASGDGASVKQILDEVVPEANLSVADNASMPQAERPASAVPVSA